MVSPQAVQQLETGPAATGRTAYRVVQEALTNVRKHAPQARVRVEVCDAGDGIDVSVRNQPSLATRGQLTPPGSGTGLAGLRERVGLAGGRIDFQPMADRGFHVRAWLPYAGSEQGAPWPSEW